MVRVRVAETELFFLRLLIEKKKKKLTLDGSSLCHWGLGTSSKWV